MYGGPGLKSIEERAMPELEAPGDAIVKMVKTTICGTDLHMLEPCPYDRSLYANP